MQGISISDTVETDTLEAVLKTLLGLKSFVGRSRYAADMSQDIYYRNL